MRRNLNAHPPLWRRPQDLLLCIGAALLILAAVGTSAALSVRYGVPWRVFFKGLDFTIYTLVVFGIWISDQRKLWRKRSFWILTTAGLAVHTLCYALLLDRLAYFKPFWFGLIGLAEVVLLIECKRWVMLHGRGRTPTAHKSRLDD